MRGGTRPGAGRPKGSPNKATVDLQDAAREYTEEALETLRAICASGQSESARVAAATALLDRGYGKPRQQLSAELTGKDGAPLADRSNSLEIFKERIDRLAQALRAPGGIPPDQAVPLNEKQSSEISPASKLDGK